MNPIPARLKKARLNAGLSQKNLGIIAGIDRFSASARMNQYEKGKHIPDFLMLKNIAKALSVPVAYFYAEDDKLAEFLIFYEQSNKGFQADWGVNITQGFSDINFHEKTKLFYNGFLKILKIY